MNILDIVMDVADDGGSSPRPRRGLSQSMIAGRRKPGDRPAADADEKPAAPARRGRRPAAAAKETAAPKETPTRRAPARRGRGKAAEPAATVADAPVKEETAPETPESPEMPEPPREAPQVTAPPELPPLPEPAPVSNGDASGLAVEVSRLRALVEQQRTVLAELRAGMLTLGQQVDRGGYRQRLGVFIDVPNLMYDVESGRPVHMGRLLDMLRDGRQLVRATAYSPVSDDPREPLEQQKFVAPFVAYDYRIVTKSLKRFADGSIKGNFDVEMAIDMILMADRVDVIAIVSGDADFARAVEAVQNRGVRVEVVAFGGSTSLEMRALADHYLDLNHMVDRIT